MRATCMTLAIPAFAILCDAQVEARYVAASGFTVSSGARGALLLDEPALLFSYPDGQIRIPYEHMLSLRIEWPYRRFDAAAQVGAGKINLPERDGVQRLSIGFEDTAGRIDMLVLEIGAGSVPFVIKTLESHSRMQVVRVRPDKRPEILFKAMTFDAPPRPDLARLDPSQQYAAQASTMPRAIFWGVGLRW
jgi:hypothetical protein